MRFHGISWDFMGFHGISRDFTGYNKVNEVVKHSKAINFRGFWCHVVYLIFPYFSLFCLEILESYRAGTERKVADTGCTLANVQQTKNETSKYCHCSDAQSYKTIFVKKFHSEKKNQNSN
jgi:hypothetical protein